MGAPYDLVVIGGGVNGCGTARDAAGRGLKVLLAEKDDLAQGTSSRSGKYIHGGLRYLEHYEFRLVREALIEREVVLDAVPHLAWPLKLILPHSPHQRPRWLIRLGLFLYDHLGGRRKIPGSRSIRLDNAHEGQMLHDAYQHGFAYYDVWVNDSRLVIVNAVDAACRGAEILTRTEVISARRDGGIWKVTLRGADGLRNVRTKTIFNAAGPWVEQIIKNVAGANSAKSIRLVKGAHLILKRWWEGGHGYVLQASDKRLIFVNPYFDDLALVGTTDIPFCGKPEEVCVDSEEINYLLDILNNYFKVTLTSDDVISTYSGVRPLFDDDSSKGASAVTRDYTFEIDGGSQGCAPLLSVFGGKLTTYRKLSEAALTHLQPFLPNMGPPWTRGVPLPGGDIPDGDFDRWFKRFETDFAWLPTDLSLYYARTYGSDARKLLAGAGRLADLGQHFGGLFYAREAEWMMEQEWAKSTEDMVTRRSKHSLFMSEAEQRVLDQWLERGCKA